jgi:hypothetical protein
MGLDIRLPNINAKTEAEQQIKSYLIQLAEQLQWALQNIDTSNRSVVVAPVSRSLMPSSSGVNTGATADAWIYNKCECSSDTGWSRLGLSSAVSQSNSALGRYQNGNVWYRVVNENHVYVAFNCAFTFNGDPITVNSTPIPSPYKPTRNVYAMCPVNNRAVARILVKPDGNILIDYVQSMETGEVTNTYTVNWIDGYIDFWV